jgi:hypothetical protein
MAGILDLDRNSFFGAMDELGIVGEQRDDLIRQYREKVIASWPAYAGWRD